MNFKILHLLYLSYAFTKRKRFAKWILANDSLFVRISLTPDLLPFVENMFNMIS